MPRRKKKCCVEQYPMRGMYMPRGEYNGEEVITIDELEAMRIVDSLEKSQIEAAEVLGVSRGTVQRLLYSGRKKLIDSIYNGKQIILDQALDAFEKEEEVMERQAKTVAFVLENGQVSGHFGHATDMSLVQIDDNHHVTNSFEYVPSFAGGRARAQFLYETNVSSLFVTEIGEGAYNVLKGFNIDVYDGTGMTIDECLSVLKEGTTKEPVIHQKLKSE